MEDQILLEAVKEIEDDHVLAEAADLIERQLAYREYYPLVELLALSCGW